MEKAKGDKHRACVNRVDEGRVTWTALQTGLGVAREGKSSRVRVRAANAL